jgi:hypothetical protein
MSATSVLSVYAQAYVAFGAAYLLFAASRGLASRVGFSQEFGLLRRVAQAMLVCAAVAPLCLAMLPRKTLPELPFHGLRLGSEGMGKALKPTRRPRAGLVATTSAAQPAEPVGFPFDRERLSAALLVLVFALGLKRAWRSRRELAAIRALLARTLPIRSLGAAIVVLSDEARVPFSIRLSRAWVVVPTSMIASRGDFRIAVAHELQHHRQRDTVWVWLFEAIRCLFPGHPFARRWLSAITELQEFSCDQALLLRKGFSSMEYGSCLLRVAETALQSREVRVGTACMAAGLGNPIDNQSFLMRRIEMLTRQKKSRVPAWTGIALGTLAVSLTVAVSYGAQQTLRPDDPDAVNPGLAAFDPAVQAIAENVLRRHLDQDFAESGFAIVADPATGHVLAAANVVRKGAPKTGVTWSLAERIEPASVLKALVVASAVDRGVARLDESFDCMKGNYPVGDQVHHDWKAFDHLTAADTVVMSSNICGIRVAERLGAVALDRSLRDFGLGADGVAQDFPGARPGQLPVPDASPGSQYVALVGSGYSNTVTTPLELVQAFGAIANGGQLLKPRPWGTRGPVAAKRVLGEDTAAKMRGVLREVVTRGTGREAESELYTIAGKTGTGFHPSESGHEAFHGDGSVAQFIGFAPASQPRVVVYATVTMPVGKRAHGGSHGGPLVRDIVEGVLQEMGVAPDKASSR